MLPKILLGSKILQSAPHIWVGLLEKKSQGLRRHHNQRETAGNVNVAGGSMKSIRACALLEQSANKHIKSYVIKYIADYVGADMAWMPAATLKVWTYRQDLSSACY